MKKALVVGINDYPTAPLRGCVNDAQAVADIIAANSDGSPNFDARVLVNVSTKSELKSRISDLFYGPSEAALLYFSGHGYIDDVGGYVVTPDFSPHDMGVSMDEILTIVNASKANNRIVILDCCYSGALGSPRVTGGQSAQISEGVTLLTASRDSEPAMEMNGHGVFTNLLLDSLAGGAADLTGNITPGSVYAYIDQALGPWDQRPIFKTNISRFFSLRSVIPQVPVAMLRQLISYFPTSDAGFPLDPSFEDTNSPQVVHHVSEPYARVENVAKFKALQKFASVGLVRPEGEEHMYFAAMHSKSCKLTALGHHYWRLVKDRRI